MKQEMKKRNKNNPISILRNAKHSKVIVRLKEDIEYHGILIEIDSYMNLILENVVEVIDETQIARYSQLFIRGNNVLFVKLDYPFTK